MDETKTADFRVRVPVKDLKRAFALAKMTAEKRSTIPVLSRAKLNLDQGLLRVTATDMDNELTITICTDAAGAGTILMPIFEMAKIVGVLPRTGVCALDARGSEVILTAGDSTWNLPCDIPPSDYPAFPAKELPKTLQAGPDVLRNILDKTLYAVSTEETRYYLNGVSLRVTTQGNQETALRAAATDGHRLAIIDVGSPGLNIPTCIIPTKAARLLREIIKKDTGSVWLAFAEDGLQLQASTFDAKLCCKMIDGKFPDIEGAVLSKIVPTSFATVGAAALGAAIRRVSAICDKGIQAVQLSFEVDGVDLSTKSHDVRALDRVPLLYTQMASADGRRETGPFVIGLNYRYAMQALDRISGDVRIEFGGAADPLRIINPADPAAFSVLMPMRV